MDETRVKLLRRNKRLIFWTRLFIETKPLNVVLTFFYLAYGLSLSQVFYLGMVWSLTSLIFEIPTGYLADVVGRKRTLTLGVLLYISGIIIFLISHSFLGFALAVILQSTAFSCFSGIDSAFIYDSLKEAGEESAMVRVSGKYFSSAQFAKIFMPLIAAFIAKDLTILQFHTLLFIDLFFSSISLIVSLFLVEPKRNYEGRQSPIQIFGKSLEVFRKDGVARKLAFNKVLFYIGCLLFWRIYQPVLKVAGISVVELGYLYAVMQIGIFSLLWFSERVKNTFGLMNFLYTPIILSLLAIVGFLIFKDKWVLYILAWFPLTFGSARDPIFVHQINLRIESFNRATTNSIFNFLRGVFDVPLNLFTGILVGININFVYLMIIFVYLACLSIFAIKPKDLMVAKDEKL